MDHIIEKNKRERKGRVYFSKETENNIVLYNSLDPIKNADERSDIYQDHIHYPFYKLTQNIIHTFKFYYTEVENLEHLQHELMVFLLSKIHLFNPSNGAKSVICIFFIFLDQYVEECTENIFEIFPKGNDARIADAILELFRKRDAIDVFNKKALYIYIREMIDVKTPKITKIANVLYGIFKKKYLFYLEQGYYPTSKV